MQDPRAWAPRSPSPPARGPLLPVSATTCGAAPGPTAPRAGAHSPLISVSVAPPLPEGLAGRVALEGLFLGVRGGGQTRILFAFFTGQQLNSCFRRLERTSAFLQGDIGDPLVIAPALLTVTGHLHQALAFPGIRVTVLWKGTKRKGLVAALGVR